MSSEESPWSREAFERRQKAAASAPQPTPAPGGILDSSAPLPQDGTLLREVMDVRQRPQEGFRRYFHGRLCRLWVWYTADRISITGFQLLHGPLEAEKAVTWYADGTFSHHEVTPDGSPGGAKRIPVLEGNGGPVVQQTLDAFTRYAAVIDPFLRDFVISKIRAASGQVRGAGTEHPG